MTRLTKPAGTVCAGPITVPQNRPQRADRPYFARATGRTFGVQAADGVTEIDLYDEIGFWGVTAQDFRQQLRSVQSSTIRLRINSPGGDVFDGIAMHNDLLAHPANVEIEVTGLAASAASLVAMAGDTVTMASNAFMMVHNAWGLVIGNRHDMRAQADVLEQIDGALADTYVARTGLGRATVVSLMDDETWIGAEDAVEQGFADRTSDGNDAQARYDLTGFKNVPTALPQLGQQVEPPATPRDLERVLRDAGYSRSQAKAAATRALGHDDNDDALRDADAHVDFYAAIERFQQSIQRCV